jgi:DNA repair protein RadC
MADGERTGPWTRVADSAAAAALLAPCFEGLAHEEVRVLHLDAELGLIGLSMAAAGQPDAVRMPVRALIAEALAVGTSALVIAHNHPSGDPRPSPADRRATQQLGEIARALDIRLIDHLVFAAARWTSFRAMGLL